MIATSKANSSDKFRGRRGKQRNSSSLTMEDFSLSKQPEEASATGDIDRLIELPPSRFYAEHQVRIKFDQHNLEELAESMRVNKQLQPIVVYPPDENGNYKIDKGERRWRASKLIEGFKLKAIINQNATDADVATKIIGQLVENIQREELRPIEAAYSMQKLMKEGLLMEEIASSLGWLSKESKKPNANKVSRYLSILKMPEEGQALVRDEVIVDVTTLEFMRKIYEIDERKFIALCDIARKDGGISRRRAEREYTQIKRNKKGDNQHEITKAEPSKQKLKEDTKHELSQPQHFLPRVIVEWKGMQKAEIVFGCGDPVDKGCAWIKFSSGDKIQADLDELKIINIYETQQ